MKKTENNKNISREKMDNKSEKNESNIVSSNTNEKEEKEKKQRKIEIIQETNDIPDLSFKVIIIGDSFVGKSSLINKAVKNEFETTYNATLGFEYFSFFVKFENTLLKLQIWDTCGQEKYQSLISNFYRNSSLAMMVYAINNKLSFKHIDYWLKEMRNLSNPDVKMFLIGNKSDLENEREVSSEEAEKYAKEFEFSKFFETSAKSGFNTQELFLEAAKILYKDYLHYKPFSQDLSSVEKLNNKHNKKNNICC